MWHETKKMETNWLTSWTELPAVQVLLCYLYCAVFESPEPRPDQPVDHT